MLREAVSAAVAATLEGINPAGGSQTTNAALESLTKVLAMQEKRAIAQEEEREKRKRKEAEGPKITEDPITVVEKEIKIKDDSNGIIDIEARSLLGRNPNAPPSEWWGPDKKWPRIARPAVGALLDVKHIMPSHVAAEAVLSYHDREQYLELKHFINRNSGGLGKIQKQWEFMKDDETGTAVGKHERKWGEVESVREAVEGVRQCG